MSREDFIPIYQRLTDFYRQKILGQDIPPGQRIDSINRIMERHQVSRETAKLVIKCLIKDGLVISKVGKGTFVNSDAHLKKIWGMVVPFYSSNIEMLITCLQEEASRRDRKLEYFFDYNHPEEEKQLVGKMIMEGYEAIIVVPNYNEMTTADFYRRLSPGSSKVLLVDNTMAGSYFRYVIQSYDLGVKRALDYLAYNRKGNILLVKEEVWKGRNLVMELIESTLQNLVEEKYPDKQLLVAARAADLSRDWILKNNITGILSCTDTVSIRVVGRLKLWGFSVPEQISLVSYGDTELTQFFNPPITAIDCKYREMAGRIGRLIDRSDLSKSSNDQHVIQPELIQRNT